jgi:hypothetical protein
VRRFWISRSKARLVSRLEARRRKARPEFVQALAAEVRPASRRRFPLSRALLAATLTLIMLVAVASVGGAGASVRKQLSAVVHSVNSTITASDRSARSSRNDDDDDDDGGGSSGGGGGDDDDDGGGGGDDDDDDGGDDDDDGDDDQYEEERRECRKALEAAHRLFHRNQNTQNISHRSYHRQLDEARDRCRSIGR